jgi:hypothetical protein
MCLGIRKDTVLRALQLTDPNRGQEFEQILPVLYFKRPLTAPRHKKNPHNHTVLLQFGFECASNRTGFIELKNRQM